jgi:hypothetical protein
MGYLRPVTRTFDFERQAWVWGLDPIQFEMVRHGYACGNCLETFSEQMRVCPVCKRQMGARELIDEPDWEAV